MTTHIPYSYKRSNARRYTFVSVGKKMIEKVVDFIPLKAKNVMNLGFGDLLPDGSIDDEVNSNNGDIVKVLATVVNILKHFTTLHPEVYIFFAGSTAERTKLYTRILKTYHASFGKEFIIYGLIGTDNENEMVVFDPVLDIEYLAFLIKRKG